MATVNWPVTNILQNILFYVQKKKETHKDLEHLYIDYILFEFVWYIYIIYKQYRMRQCHLYQYTVQVHLNKLECRGKVNLFQ